MWVIYRVITITTHLMILGTQPEHLISGAEVQAHTTSVSNHNFSKKRGFLVSVGGEQPITRLLLQRQESTAVFCVFGEAKKSLSP
jgi:hypothetical protein